MRWWLGVAASEHIELAVEGSFAQLGHGKRSAVASLEHGDGLIYYAPRTKLKGGDPVQAFVALGRISVGDPYLAIEGGFDAYRVDVDYITSERADVHPLLHELKLTEGLGNKWGVAVRTSKKRLEEADARCIAQAMRADLSMFDA